MSKLTLDEFRKLPYEEKGVRVYELSDHDRFLMRITENTFSLKPHHEPVTKEEWERLPLALQEFLHELKPID